MTDKADRTSKAPLSGAIWPGLFVIFLVAGAYVTQHGPLESRRPSLSSNPSEPPPRTVDDIGAVHARLWEDPLGVVYRDEKHKQALADDLFRSRPSTFRETIDHLLSAGLGQSDKNEGTIPQFNINRFHKIVTDSKGSGNGKLLLMPVLLPGGPYAEDQERRMRIRYAVLAGLGTCHYSLDLSDRMSYVRIPLTTYFPTVGDKQASPENGTLKGSTITKDIVVPVKLYRQDKIRHEHDVAFGGVLVCWVNEDQLGARPLTALRDITNGLFSQCDQTRISTRIIGPSQSGTLLKMVDEDREDDLWFWPSEFFPHGSQLLSPRATVSPKIVRLKEEGADANRPFQLENCGLQLIRTIGTDRQLVKELATELSLRGAWPENEDCKQHIVLVAEQDTLYGRALPGTFRQEIGEDLEDNLHVFKYLRGIDGRVPGAQGDRQEEDKGKRDDNARVEDESPMGPAQLDYLRRLERRIEQLDKELRHEGKGQIKAIGIVGTDFYDKLLVLRAMHRCFPHAWFFTTDLEAGFAHPAEYAYTRNLLVASHFGLRLSKRLQRTVPPFRDSYQTAAFFTTLLALNDPEVERVLPKLALDDPWGMEKKGGKSNKYLQPLSFEIGRHGPYQLTMTNHVQQDTLRSERCPTVAKVHPPSPRELTRPWWGFAMGAFLCLLVCALFVNRNARAVTAAVFKGTVSLLACVLWTVVLLLGLIARVGRDTKKDDEEKEPSGVLDDFIQWSRRMPQKATWCLAREALMGFFSILAICLFVWLSATIHYDHRAPGGEPFAFFEGISVWPSTLLRFVLIVLSVVFFWVGITKLQNNHKAIAARHSRITSISPQDLQWHGWPSCDVLAEGSRLAKLFRGLFACGWPGKTGTAQGKASGKKALYQQYHYLGWWPWRLLRTGVMTAAYLGFGMLLLSFTEGPNMPCRGEVARMFAKPILFVAVLGTLALIFFALDANQLCRQFLKRFLELDNSRTDESNGLSDEDFSDALQAVRVVADRTSVVGRSIMYPFVAILLLALSRLQLTDKWSFPWSLALLMLLNVGLAVIGAIVLRMMARAARHKMLLRLKDGLIEAIALPRSQPSQQTKAWEKTIDEIQLEKRGAFSPWAEDPLFRAIAIPFGGIGGVALIQNLLPYL